MGDPNVYEDASHITGIPRTVLPTAVLPAPVVLVLPEPPSANVYWQTVNGRMYVTHEAREYRRTALAAAGVKNAPIFPSGDLSLVIIWHRAIRLGNLDNRVKILQDALQSVKKRIPNTKGGKRKTETITLAPGVYDDDEQIVQIWARRCDEHKDIPKGHVRIEVTAA